MLPCRGKQPQNLLLLFHKLAQQGAKEKGRRNKEHGSGNHMDNELDFLWTDDGGHRQIGALH